MTNEENDEVDLNISNYSLDDILELFKIPVDFTKEQLRATKRIVLMTHPDKSGKPADVFLFFCDAYKLLYEVYNFRNRSNNKNNEKTTYVADDIKIGLDTDTNTMKKFAECNNFNDRFNSIWETHNAKYGDEEGYGDWLGSENENNNKIASSMDDVNRQIDERKRNLRALVVHHSVIESGSIGLSGHSNLTRENPGCYESPVFGGLQYDDVRRAYTETVVPVTAEDYTGKQMFKSIDELQRFRGTDFTQHFSESDHESKFKEMTLNDTHSSAKRAYELAREDERLRDVRNGWNSSLLLLKTNI